MESEKRSARAVLRVRERKKGNREKEEEGKRKGVEVAGAKSFGDGRG